MDTEPRGSPVGSVVLFCREDSESCVPSPASGRYLFYRPCPLPLVQSTPHKLRIKSELNSLP